MKGEIEQKKKKLKKKFELTATTSNYFQRFRLSIFVARLKKKDFFSSHPCKRKISIVIQG